MTRGWKIEDAKFSTAREGADAVGAIMVRGDNLPNIEGSTLAIGFQNSNARRKALQITVGTEIMCCTNGMCTGEILLNRMHDHSINLFDELELAVDAWGASVDEIPASIERLKEYELTDEQAAELLMRAGREGLLCWSGIGRLHKEYRKPTFGEHGKGTSWAMLNAFTYAGRKNIAPVNQMNVYNRFQSYLPQAVLN